MTPSNQPVIATAKISTVARMRRSFTSLSMGRCLG
jgi:hypothetical protein